VTSCINRLILQGDITPDTLSFEIFINMKAAIVNYHANIWRAREKQNLTTYFDWLTVLQEGFGRYAKAERINTDQGCLFTLYGLVRVINQHGQTRSLTSQYHC